MEKLSLEKFSDSKLESESMALVNGGVMQDGCTGGGYTLFTSPHHQDFVMHYESDCTDENGTVFYGATYDFA